MKVKYLGTMEKGLANIMWIGSFPMRHGKFPTNHPVGGVCCDDMQFGSGDNIKKFRARGYWASCFPDGDGICLRVQGQPPTDKIVSDIIDCFGWEVDVQRKQYY